MVLQMASPQRNAVGGKQSHQPHQTGARTTCQRAQQSPRPHKTPQRRNLISMIEIIKSPELIGYEEALATMEERVADISQGTASEAIWLLEHPPLYTAGTSAKSGDLLTPDRFPVHKAGRGGQYTYHGPGQRVVYVMVDVRQRFGGDVRKFVKALENSVIAVLRKFDIAGEIRDGRVGVWVKMPMEAAEAAHSPLAAETEAKIAALGIRIRRGISFHGISINLDPDLSHFAGIVPCGLGEFGVTSIAQLRQGVTMADLDRAIADVLLPCLETSLPAQRVATAR